MALSVKLNLSKFLNGIFKAVFIMLPEGFKKNKILKLKKVVYGLKQSSRAWYERIDNVLKNPG